jgi:hypothetical protein
MKRVDASKCEMEYYECTCGFHFGIDATYLDQVEEHIQVKCPACDNKHIFTTLDDVDPDFEDQLKVRVSLSSDAILIRAEGYRTYHDDVPMLVELNCGDLKLVAWSDRELEDYTHSINFDRARDKPVTKSE